MTTPAERFKGWIDNLADSWKDRLRGWMASWVMKGVEILLSSLEEEAKPGAQDFLDRFPIHPAIKGELQAFLDKERPVHIPVFASMAIGVVIGSLIGTFMGWAAPVASWTSYQGQKLIHSFRLDPMATITSWRRDPAKYEKFFEDLRDQGWTDDRIEALKFYTLFIPTADEQTHWLAREVYEPEMVARYGLDSELPVYEETDFSKIGVSPEQMRNKWLAHWEHASYMQVREMLRRGVLSLDKTMPSPPTTEAGWKTRDAEGFKAMYDWYRLVEIPPFWRDRLTEMIWEVPTRVDVRRFWDMRTIDEERLRSIYHARGYHGKDLDDYVLWTKVYVAFPDLMARFKNGWITEDEVRSELTGLGMPSERVEEMIQTKIKTVAPERVAAEKTATATEIMKAVKKGLIVWDAGIERLGRMGY
ncbi:unnamed protein product, partial [marine sediment metagenome]